MNEDDFDSDPDALPPLPPGCPLDDRRAPENRDQEIRRAFSEGRRFQRRRFVKRWGITLATLVAGTGGLWQAGVIKPGVEKEPVVSARTIDARLERLEVDVREMKSAFERRVAANDEQLNQWREDRDEHKAFLKQQEADMRVVLRRLDAFAIKLGMQLGRLDEPRTPTDDGVTIYATPAVAEVR